MTAVILSSLTAVVGALSLGELYLFEPRRAWKAETASDDWHGAEAGWRPAQPGETPGELVPEGDPVQPLDGDQLPTRVPGANLDEADAALAPDQGAPLELVEAVAASWWMRPRHTYTPELWAATSQATQAVTRTLGGRRGRHRASPWARAYRILRRACSVIEPQTSFARWGRRVVSA